MGKLEALSDPEREIIENLATHGGPKAPWRKGRECTMALRKEITEKMAGQGRNPDDVVNGLIQKIAPGAPRAEGHEVPQKDDPGGLFGREYHIPLEVEHAMWVIWDEVQQQKATGSAAGERHGAATVPAPAAASEPDDLGGGMTVEAHSAPEEGAAKNARVGDRVKVMLEKLFPGGGKGSGHGGRE